MRHRSWSRVLCYAAPSATGPVYKASRVMEDSELARLPYHNREEAILQKWPSLTVWGTYKVHRSGRGRNPPWSTLDDAVLVQEHPDGVNVPILCVVYEGGGPNDYALTLHRHSTILTVYHIVECAFRCMSEQYICTSTVNQIPVQLQEVLSLDEGDYIEILIFSVTRMQLRHTTISTPDEAREISGSQSIHVDNRVTHDNGGQIACRENSGIALLQTLMWRHRPTNFAPRVRSTTTTTLVATYYTTTMKVSLWRLETHSFFCACASLQVRLLQHDLIHQLEIVVEALFGGSYSGYTVGRRQTRSRSEISRHALRLSGDPPLWDVDAIFNGLISCGYGSVDPMLHEVSLVWTGARWKHSTVDTVGDTVATYNYSFLTFTALPPPGNGTIKDFRTGRLDMLDAVVVIGDTYYIYDVPTSVGECGTQRKCLLLDDHLTQGPRRPERLDQAVSIDVPEVTTNVLTMILHGPLRSMPLRPIPTLPWHDTTVHQLHNSLVLPVCHGLEVVELYTDGSAGTLYADYEYFEHAAWGFVVVGWTLPEQYTVIAMDGGHVQNDNKKEDWTGAQRLNAMAGERAALIAAATWLLRARYRGTAVFRFDSVAAGYGASGQWNTTPGRNDATLLRVLFQLLALQPGLTVRCEHVKAHTGDPWNECANTLAHHAWTTRIQNPVLDVDVRDVLCQERPLCMQWPLLLDKTCGVDFDFGYLSWYRDTSEPRPDIVWQALPKATPLQTKELTLRMASYNVCTLGGKGHNVSMTNFLRAQLHSQGLDIVGLQETRARTTKVVHTVDFIRYISAADEKGHGGTEIWLAKHGQLAKMVRHKQTAVLHQDHETIILRLMVGGEELCVIAAHGPHSGRPHTYITEWWQQLLNIYQKHIGQKTCIVLVDANAHFHCQEEPCVGKLGLEENGNTCARCFGDFLQLTQLCLPSTFEQYHSGQTATWRHPHRGTLHRCDYVAVPQSWLCFELQSWVDGCLDTGRLGLDHIAVVLQATLQWRVGGKRPDWPTIPLNRHAVQGAQEGQIDQMFNGLPNYQWHVNIHEHAAMMVNDLQTAMVAVFPSKQKPPRAGYISSAAWDIRSLRRQHRRALFQSRDLFGREVCARSFYLWKYWVLRDQERLSWHKERAVDTHGDLIATLKVHALGRQLKAQLAQDRKEHLTRLADEAAHAAPNVVFSKLRALGVCGKRRRREIMPLPLVHDGEDVDDLHAKWRRHFEELEDGIQVEPQQLLRDCDRVQRSRRTILPDFDELPTLLELEHSLRTNVNGKACFFDGIPTELAHAFPQKLARYFFPLMVKQALLISEPVTFKGGILVSAYKGKGSMGQCENYRSLMISSIFSKCVHRILRRQVVGHLEKFSVYRVSLGDCQGKRLHKLLKFYWRGHPTINS